MYSVVRDRDVWEILLESAEDKLAAEESLGVGVERTINETFIRGKEEVYWLHEKGQSWFTVFIRAKEEPGPEFHKEMRRRGVTRAYLKL